MKREDIQRINNLESCIKTAESNIEGWEKLKQAKEIIITSTGEPNKYVTGKMKDKIIDILIQEQREFLEKKLSELESI